jgi:hypothetical protein
MEVAGVELDNQQAARSAEAHVLAPERESSRDSAEGAVAASNPVVGREPVGKRVADKGKEKVDRKLQCNNTDSNDEDSPNADDVGVRDGPGSCSQTMDSNDELASRSVALEVGEHSEPHTMPTTSIDDALFNAAGKAPHSDAVIVKQEAGWFQLRAEKRQRSWPRSKRKRDLRRKPRMQGIRLRY